MAQDRDRPPQKFQSNISDSKNWLEKEENIARLLNISEDKNIGELIEHIKKFMFDTRGKITTNQLRNIYAKVKKPQSQDPKRLQLIRPHLAYIAARQNNLVAREVVEFLEKVVSKVDTKEKVEEFTTFFEAVVAYHKFYNTEKN